MDNVGKCQCGAPFWQNAPNQLMCPKCSEKYKKLRKHESRLKTRHRQRGYAGVNVRDIGNEMKRRARYENASAKC